MDISFKSSIIMKKLFLLFFGLLPVMLFAQYPYEKQTTQVGIVDTVGGEPYSPPLWGTGVSFCDFNNDGLDDITVGTGRGRQVLFYSNNGDDTFTKLTSPINFTEETKAVLWADIDNDGDKDLFVGGWKKPNALFENDGNFNFTDITASSGLPIQNDWTWGATFGDYNKDGFLDLYVCNRNNTIYTNYLYHNNGDNTFTDVTNAAGVSDGNQLTFCAAWMDIDNDGNQDLYMANDRVYSNTMFHNNGDGTFDNISVASGAGISIDAMNTGIGDFNNDGWDDIYVTNTPNGGNSLLRNNGDNTFTDVASTAGVGFFNFTWGGNWLDFDNDTDLDLYVSCMSERADEPNWLYRNELVESGTETFTTPWVLGFPGDTVPSYANAIGDFNDDGLLDIVVPNNESDTIYLWKNIVDNGNNWVKVSLQGLVSNRDGIGSRIEVWIDGQKLIRYTHCGDAYISQNSNKVHVGIGAATEIDSIVIKWLSGIVDVVDNPAINTIHNIVENSTDQDITVEVTGEAASCDGFSDGTATALPSGGTEPYTYAWNNGMTTSSISGLPSGSYVVTVTDDTGLTGIGFFNVTDPPSIAISLTPSNTTGGSDGAIDLAVSGGTTPYSFLWSNDATTQDLMNITAGTYSVTVTDDNGCTAEGATTVYDENGECGFFVPNSVITTSNSATLSWNPVPNALNYRIRYREQGASVWESSVSSGTANITIFSLNNGVTYEYQTKTACPETRSAWSPIYTFTTDNEGPGICDAWEPDMITTDVTSAIIMWFDEPDAAKYRLRYRVVGTMDWTPSITVNPLLTLTGLDPDTDYEFITATRCPYGWSDWSTTMYNFSTLPDELEMKIPNTNDMPNKGVNNKETGDFAYTLLPNPAKSFVQVNIKDIQAEWILLRDLNGKLIQQINITNQVEEIALDELPAGIYFVTVGGNQLSPVTKRFVKSN
jgi:hypothetical protein